MNLRTAFAGSIKKWRNIDGLEDTAFSLCGLCYYSRESKYKRKNKLSPTCDFCPIYFKTGGLVCSLTPYQDLIDHIKIAHKSGEIDHVGFNPFCDECEFYRLQMIDFLITLKDEEHRRGNLTKSKEGLHV